MCDKPADPRYQEILKLDKLLTEAGIPHCTERKLDGWHIQYPVAGGLVICSIVEFTGSYGHRHNRLEIQGLLNKAERKYNTVVGFLSAEKVFDRIKADWERRKERNGKAGRN